MQRYRERISGPLLDRIDIHLEVGAITYNEISSKESGESSESMRERVTRAREIQRERFGAKSKVRCNARMSSRQIKTHCELDEAGEGMMRMAMTELHLSARAYDRILKVARAIADLRLLNASPRSMSRRLYNIGRWIGICGVEAPVDGSQLLTDHLTDPGRVRMTILRD